MPNGTAYQLIVTDVETADIAVLGDQDVYTRGFIVPAGVDPSADLELESVAHVDIPAAEEPAAWQRGMRVVAGRAGWRIGTVTQNGTTLTAPATRIPPLKMTDTCARVIRSFLGDRSAVADMRGDVYSKARTRCQVAGWLQSSDEFPFNTVTPAGRQAARDFSGN